MRASKAVLLITYIPYCGGFTTSGWWVQSGRRRLVKNCLSSSFVNGLRPADVFTRDTSVDEAEGEKVREYNWLKGDWSFMALGYLDDDALEIACIPHEGR